MTIHTGHTYKITNVKGGTVVDLSGGDNKSIIGYDNHGGPNQKWVFDYHGSGWSIRSAGSGGFLGIERDPGDGVPLVALGSEFLWEIKPDEENKSHYRLFVPNTKYNMDLSDHGNSAPGTRVTLWGHWKGTNQTWIIQDA